MSQQKTKNQSGSIFIIAVITLLILAIAGLAGYKVYKSNPSSSYQETNTTIEASELTNDYSVKLLDKNIHFRYLTGGEVLTYDQREVIACEGHRKTGYLESEPSIQKQCDNIDDPIDEDCPLYDKADFMEANRVRLTLYYYDPDCDQLNSRSVNGSVAMPRSGNDANRDRTVLKRFQTTIGEATVYEQEETYCTNSCSDQTVPYIFIDVSKASRENSRAILLIGYGAESVASTLAFGE